MRRRENDMLWNTQHERNRANHIISSGLRHSFLHLFVLLALKLPAKGYYMLRPFSHPAAYCCVLLGVVEQSLKPAKLLTQRLPTFLLFRDRRSVAQQCWIRLHSFFQLCWGHVATHDNYTWLYPPHDALQVPKVGSCSVSTPLHTRKEATTPCYFRLHVTLVAFKSFSGRYSWSLQIRLLHLKYCSNSTCTLRGVRLVLGLG